MGCFGSDDGLNVLVWMGLAHLRYHSYSETTPSSTACPGPSLVRPSMGRSDREMDSVSESDGGAGGGRVEEMQAVASDGGAAVTPEISVDGGGSTPWS
jgi:hypothetical protein